MDKKNLSYEEFAKMEIKYLFKGYIKKGNDVNWYLVPNNAHESFEFLKGISIEKDSEDGKYIECYFTSKEKLKYINESRIHAWKAICEPAKKSNDLDKSWLDDILI